MALFGGGDSRLVFRAQTDSFGPVLFAGTVFFAGGLCGAGGDASIRLNTSSSFGCGGFFFMALDSFQTNRLRFNSVDDAFNFARVSVEQGRDWLALHNISFANNYMKGDIELHLYVASRAHSCKFKLVSVIVPFVDSECDRTRDVQPVGVKIKRIGIGTQADDALMYSGGKSGQRPKKTVTAKVRFEGCDECAEFGSKLLAMVLNFGCEIVFVDPEREINATAICDSEKGGAVASGLIQRVAKIVNDPREQHHQFAGDPFIESELYDLLFGMRIDLFDRGVDVAFNESVACRFDLENVFFSCPD